MANKNARLLTTTELIDIYGMPTFNEVERHAYFTLTIQETTVANSFKNTSYAVYFVICLVFFKEKQTFVDFNYQSTTEERRHVMQRYFPNQTSPRALPKNNSTLAQIKNKVLTLCGYQRFSGAITHTLQQELQRVASYNPRQRQLCKTLLDLFTKHKVAIPSYSTIQRIISTVSNTEMQRVVEAYLRHTQKSERLTVASLIDKNDNFHSIVNIKKEIKTFNTHDLWQEIEKHQQLTPVFNIAKPVIPKLRLPTVTIHYYAGLIHYYNGVRLHQLNPDTAQIYLLCYGFTRYQMLNDNFLDALKKRTLEYKAKAVQYAKEHAVKYIDSIKKARKQASDLLIAIKNYPDRQQIPCSEIYKYIPEDELLTAAKLLVDENFDKEFLFWKYIDNAIDSIKLNVRKLFVTIDLEITHDDLFAEIVRHIKSELVASVFGNHPLPHHFKAWIGKNDAAYLIDNNAIIPHRFEFLLYMRLVHHMATNKLTLKHSIKYKKLEDDLYQDSVWKKNKRTILQKIDYPKLNCAIKKTLKTKRQHLSALYQTVNQALLNGENEDIKINPQTQAWRLRSLKLMDDPNDSLFVNFPQRSIVEVMQFVNKKTHFTKAFEPILPKSKKGELVEEHIMAVVLANAIRMGARKMSGVCDLNESTLITAESAYIRQETLKAAIDIVNNAAEKLPIYKKWYINSIPHASLDGLKLGTQKRHGMARHSSKYFGRGTGVSAYNEIMNFFSIAGKLIGSHEYEGSFLFEMVHHQNSSEIKPTTISTDKHGTNALNFGLFDLTEIAFSPRIPKPHRETFWGFGSAKDYEGSIIKPTKFMDEELFIEEWDNIQRLVASLLTGESNPNVAIRKLSSKDYTSNTKKAFVQYNHIVRSEFLLRYLHDAELRRAILCALNRGEAYNHLYRAIAILRKGEFRGQSEIEMENWNQCTRLISSIILYYNTYLLNSLYKQAKTEQEKAFLVNLSPSAWIHVNLLGYYLFCGHFSDNTIERYLREWDWQRHVTL